MSPAKTCTSSRNPGDYLRRWGVLAAGAVLLSAASCEEDDVVDLTAPLELRIVGELEGSSLALESKTYAAPSAAEGFRLSRLSFFVSDIRLVNRDGGTTDLSEVEYLELGPSGLASFTVPEVPRGEYVGLQFRLGLTAAQDSMQPKDFPAGSPLAMSAEYWVDWGSYVFMKIEGSTDTLADGRARFEQPFLFHIGQAATYGRELSFDQPITIGGATDGVVNIGLDVDELLGLNSTEPLPVDGTIDHRSQFAADIMDNAMLAFRVLR